MNANILHMTHLLNSEKTFFFAAWAHQSLRVQHLPDCRVLKTGALVRITCTNTGGHVALSAEASKR